jgi:anti-sigma-K factor RskA
MAREPRRTPAARASARTRTTTTKKISPEWRGALIAGGILLAIVVAYNVGNGNLASSAPPYVAAVAPAQVAPHSAVVGRIGNHHKVVAECGEGVAYFDKRPQYERTRCWPAGTPLPSWAQ